MVDRKFFVEPTSIPIGDTSVTAQIRLDQPGDQWDVIIVISRAPGLDPIQGQEVDAQLIDAQGSSMKVLERPTRLLVEVGGSLGTSANARFRFQDSTAVPERLLVTYQDQTASFRVVSSKPRSS